MCVAESVLASIFKESAFASLSLIMPSVLPFSTPAYPVECNKFLVKWLEDYLFKPVRRLVI